MNGYMNTTEKLEANKPIIFGVKITWLKKVFYFELSKKMSNNNKHVIARNKLVWLKRYFILM